MDPKYWAVDCVNLVVNTQQGHTSYIDDVQKFLVVFAEMQILFVIVEEILRAIRKTGADSAQYTHLS